MSTPKPTDHGAQGIAPPCRVSPSTDSIPSPLPLGLQANQARGSPTLPLTKTPASVARSWHLLFSQHGPLAVVGWHSSNPSTTGRLRHSAPRILPARDGHPNCRGAIEKKEKIITICPNMGLLLLAGIASPPSSPLWLCCRHPLPPKSQLLCHLREHPALQVTAAALRISAPPESHRQTSDAARESCLQAVAPANPPQAEMIHEITSDHRLGSTLGDAGGVGDAGALRGGSAAVQRIC